MLKGSDANGKVDTDETNAATSQRLQDATTTPPVTVDPAVVDDDGKGALASDGHGPTTPDNEDVEVEGSSRASQRPLQLQLVGEKLSTISENATNDSLETRIEAAGQSSSAQGSIAQTPAAAFNSSEMVAMDTVEAQASALSNSTVLSQPAAATAATLSGPARRSRNESFKQFTERVRTFSNDLLRSIEMAHDIADLRNSNFSAATQSAAAQQYYSNLESSQDDHHEQAMGGHLAVGGSSTTHPRHRYLPKSKSRSSEMSHHHVSSCSDFDEETPVYYVDRSTAQASPHVVSRASIEDETIREEAEEEGQASRNQSVKRRAATISMMTGGQAPVVTIKPRLDSEKQSVSTGPTLPQAAGAGTATPQLSSLRLEGDKTLSLGSKDHASLYTHSTNRLDNSAPSPTAETVAAAKVDTQVIQDMGKDQTDFRVKTKTVMKNGVKKKIPDDIHISILEVFIYLWGVTTFFVDLISDIILSVEYFNNDSKWLGTLTLMFVIIPNLTLSLFSLSWYIDTYNLTRNSIIHANQNGKASSSKHKRIHEQSTFDKIIFWFMTVLFVVFQLDLIWKYIQGFVFTLKGWVCRSILRNPKWEKYYIEKQIKCDTDIGMLRLIDVFLDSGPQVLLQLYVITTQDLKDSKGSGVFALPFNNGNIGKRELKQLVSIISSLFSMGYALAGYHRCLRNQQFIFCLEQNEQDKSMARPMRWQDKPLPRPMRWISTFMQFFWYLFLITPRVLSMAIFASTYRAWFFMIILIHWLVMYFWILTLKTNYCITSQDVYNAREEIFEKFYNFVCSFIYIFVYFNLKSGATRFRYLIYYIIYYAENVIFGVCYFLSPIEPNYTYKLTMLVIVLGGFWVAITFQVIYYLHCHPSHDIRVCVKKKKQFHLVHAKKLRPPLLSSESESDAASNLSVPYLMNHKSNLNDKSTTKDGPGEARSADHGEMGLIAEIESDRNAQMTKAKTRGESNGSREQQQNSAPLFSFQSLVKDETSKQSVKLVGNDSHNNKLVNRFSAKLSKTRQQQVKPIVDDTQQAIRNCNYPASSSSSSIVNYDNSSSSVKLISINRLNSASLLSPLKSSSAADTTGAKYETLTNTENGQNDSEPAAVAAVNSGGGGSGSNSVKRFNKNGKTSVNKDPLAINLKPSSRPKKSKKQPYSKQTSLSNNPIVVSGGSSSSKSNDSIASSVAVLNESKTKQRPSKELRKRVTNEQSNLAFKAKSSDVEANDGDDEDIELSRRNSATKSSAHSIASIHLKDFRLDTPKSMSSISSFLSFSNVSMTSDDDSLFFKNSIHLSQLNLKPSMLHLSEDEFVDVQSIFEPQNELDSPQNVIFRRELAGVAANSPPLANTDELDDL